MPDSMSFARLAEKFFLPEFSNRLYHIDTVSLDFSGVDTVGIYIHVPFCNSLCPYCPYDRVLYNSELMARYVNALKREILLKSSLMKNVRISSVYIGGGTPTTAMKYFPDVMKMFKKHFDLSGGIFIETNPQDITPEKLQSLKKMGVSMISIGVQSFQDKYLRLIGRNYDRAIAKRAVKIARNYFDNINIDLMFALPNQTLTDFYSDLKEASALGVNQITAYPLFTFPYSSAGRFLRVKNVKLPNFFVRKKMFELMRDFLTSEGFYPVSVWGFKRGSLPEFSSVSRIYYVGFGPSAATKLKNALYMNTFSVNRYVERLFEGRFAEVAKMDFTDLMDDYYYFYWKLYETRVPKLEFDEMFCCGIKKRAKALMSLLICFGMAKEEDNYYALTKRGMFYVHLMQNHFSMNYISEIWQQMMENPEPEEIIL